MADIVKDATDYRIKQIEIAEEKYYKTLIATLDRIEREVVELANRDLKKTTDGRLIELQAAIAIRPKIKAILDREYLSWSDTVVREGFTKQAKRVEKAFKRIGNIPVEFQELTKGDLALVQNLKQQYFTQFKDVSNTFTRRLSEKVYQNTLVGNSFVELEKELKQTINGIYASSNDAEANRLIDFINNNIGIITDSVTIDWGNGNVITIDGQFDNPINVQYDNSNNYEISITPFNNGCSYTSSYEVYGGLIIDSITGGEIGDSLFFSCDKEINVLQLMSLARDKIGSDLNLIDENLFAFCWIVDYPMFEKNEETKKIEFSHNPFSMPQGDLDKIDYEKMNTSTKYRTVRYGNVLYSTGSVLCKWKDRILNDEELIITDPKATRFYWSIDQAIDLIFDCLKNAKDSSPYVPEMKSVFLKLWKNG